MKHEKRIDFFSFMDLHVIYQCVVRLEKYCTTLHVRYSADVVCLVCILCNSRYTHSAVLNAPQDFF